MSGLNVTERRLQPPDIGVSVVTLSLGHRTGHNPEAGPRRNNVGQDSAKQDSADWDNAGQNSAKQDSADSDSAGPGVEAEARQELWIPLVRRIRQPYRGLWALPGGTLQAYQSLEGSAYRALSSTTELHPKYLEQLYTFGGPQRSHGGLPMVSIVYWALVDSLETDALRESDNVAWFPEHRLPALAFDHHGIIQYALQRLRSKIEYPDIVTRLVGSTFTLAQLHAVYEAVSDRHIDLANFRRRMLASGRIERTGRQERRGRQRPASLYRYVPADVASDTGADTSVRPYDEAAEQQSDIDLDDVLSPLTTTARNAGLASQRSAGDGGLSLYTDLKEPL